MKDYLGDGAYVEFNGYEVILSAPRGPDQIDMVVLGRYEYEAFKRFMQRTPWGGLAVTLHTCPECQSWRWADLSCEDAACTFYKLPISEILDRLKRGGVNDPRPRLCRPSDEPDDASDK